MKKRTLDIRLSARARKDLTQLHGALGLGRPGDVIAHLLANGHIPDPTLSLRSDYSERMRATLPADLAQDIADVAKADGLSIETWLEALIRTAHRQLCGDQIQCASPQSSSDRAFASSLFALAPSFSRGRSRG